MGYKLYKQNYPPSCSTFPIYLIRLKRYSAGDLFASYHTGSTDNDLISNIAFYVYTLVLMKYPHKFRCLNPSPTRPTRPAPKSQVN